VKYLSDGFYAEKIARARNKELDRRPNIMKKTARSVVTNGQAGV